MTWALHEAQSPSPNGLKGLKGPRKLWSWSFVSQSASHSSREKCLTSIAQRFCQINPSDVLKRQSYCQVSLFSYAKHSSIMPFLQEIDELFSEESNLIIEKKWKWRKISFPIHSTRQNRQHLTSTKMHLGFLKPFAYKSQNLLQNHAPKVEGDDSYLIQRMLILALCTLTPTV